MSNVSITKVRASRTKVSKNYPAAHIIYNGGFEEYEDPADYVRIPSVKAVRLG